MVNNYSSHWFEFFLRTIPSAQTEREIQFLQRRLPNPPYRNVLDICCGEGRHANRLSGLGYDVTGIDSNESALQIARRASAPTALFLRGDMRDLQNIPGPHDAVICLWQSFGYFDEATNRSVLRQMSNALRPAGRLILDVNHRGFFEEHPGDRTVEKLGLKMTITSRMTGNRQRVVLTDARNNLQHQFDWQLFIPEELSALGNSCGLKTLLTCAEFDESTPASAKNPRMQVVMERI